MSVWIGAHLLIVVTRPTLRVGWAVFFWTWPHWFNLGWVGLGHFGPGPLYDCCATPIIFSVPGPCWFIWSRPIYFNSAQLSQFGPDSLLDCCIGPIIVGLNLAHISPSYSRCMYFRLSSAHPVWSGSSVLLGCASICGLVGLGMGRVRANRARLMFLQLDLPLSELGLVQMLEFSLWPKCLGLVQILF